MWDNILERTRDPYSTTSIETEIRKRKLGAFLTRQGIRSDIVCIDAGCADGRVTHMMLNLGMKHVISLDLDPSNLKRGRKVSPIQADFCRLPIRDEAVSLIVAFGLLHLLQNPRLGVEEIARVLKPGGFAYCAEPTLEHALIYSLVRGDIDEFLRVAQNHTRALMWNKREERYLVTLQREIGAIFDHPELEVIERDGISILPSLLFGGLLQEQPADKDLIRDTVLGLDIETYRQSICVVKKN